MSGQTGSLTVGLVQMRSTPDYLENLAVLREGISVAAQNGANYVQTPEMSLVMDRDRERLMTQVFPDHIRQSHSGLHNEPNRDSSGQLQINPQIQACVELALEFGVWLHIGSLAVRADHGKAINRGVLISPAGQRVAFYDKIHMFDVDLPDGEVWRESNSYVGGKHAVCVHTPKFNLGMSICYDLRFGDQYQVMARDGAQILTCPAAFTKQTGEAHWHCLLRARAIECGAFVIAAAQGGHHEDGRKTFGHSLVVNPWGKIVGELDHDEPDVLICKLDLNEVKQARSRIPNLGQNPQYELLSQKVDS